MNQRTNPLADKLIEDLADTLQIPPARYEAADRSYKSIAEWLERQNSIFSRVHINAYIQGSFRLGTAIRPISEDEHYDLDVVCEFTLPKSSTTQQALHHNLGTELKAYARRFGMDEPSPSRRCWTLNYSESAQFHMDILPSIPDGQLQTRLREQIFVELAHVETSIAITDTKHHNFRHRSDEWPIRIFYQ